MSAAACPTFGTSGKPGRLEWDAHDGLCTGHPHHNCGQHHCTHGPLWFRTFHILARSHIWIHTLELLVKDIENKWGSITHFHQHTSTIRNPSPSGRNCHLYNRPAIVSGLISAGRWTRGLYGGASCVGYGMCHSNQCLLLGHVGHSRITPSSHTCLVPSKRLLWKLTFPQECCRKNIWTFWRAVLQNSIYLKNDGWWAGDLSTSSTFRNFAKFQNSN